MSSKEQTTVQRERLSSNQFDQFRDFIYEHSGIHIPKNRVILLSNRIRRRIREAGFEDFDAYYRFLTSPDGGGELVGLLNAVTTNETYFFRTPKQFDWLKDEWLKEQVAQHRAGNRKPQLRIWSAGCANGAEPYSIAICLAENLYRLAGWSLEVVGTDISEEMLEAARGGVFAPRAVEAVTKQQRRRYFRYETERDVWQIRESIMQMVEFKKHNLMRPAPRPVFDCIFIRNVLIYFDRESKQTVLKNLFNALAVGGYLVVGPSEGVFGMLEGFNRISPLVYQKGDKSSAARPTIAQGGEQP